MAETFAQFLRRHDYVTAEELEEATQATVLFGGRLGTALLELGALAPEELDDALAKFMKLPPIPKEWLEKPDPAARAALHLDLVKRHRAFPLLFEKRTLHVGMVDPRNEAQIEELSFASGCVIAPHALPEFRFVQLMQHFYRVGASVRFRMLLEENQRARQMREHTRARQTRAREPEAPKRDLPIEPLPADFELTDEEAFKSAPIVQAPRLHAAPSPRGPQPASVAPPPPLVAKTTPPAKPSEAPPIQSTPATSPLPALANEPALEVDEPTLPTPPPAPKREAALASSLAALERIVIESGERGEVIEASLALASRFTDVAAIFVVREGVAAGLCGTRNGTPLGVESTLLPLAGEGLATSAARDHKPAIGAPNAALDKLFAKALRLRDDAEFGVFPVLIGDRVANLVVAQCAGERFPRLAEAALRALAWLLGHAYERLIRIQKQKSALPASAAPAPATKGTLGALPLQKRVVRVDGTQG